MVVFISRSFSKCGLAGCRIGYLISSKKIAGLLYKFRPFYELTSFSSFVLEEIINSNNIIQKYIQETLQGKKYLEQQLINLKIDFFKTNTNFILLKFKSKKFKDEIRKYLLSKNFLVLGESKLLEGEKILRITLGPKKYMKLLTDKLYLFYEKKKV